MARSANQKLKLLYLNKILLENTDNEHGLSLQQITDMLASYGITAERKSLYDDFEALRLFGVDVETRRGKHTEYYVGERDFQLPELKLLVDSVQSSKFITKSKSDELICKLEALASRYDAQKLHRQVYVANRVKTMNESIYYLVDELYEAIFSNRSVSFQYFDWNTKKEKILRHDGKRYNVSPFALTYDDENYYLIAYDHEKNMIRHFRVDKITCMKVSSEAREGRELFEKFDIAKYTGRHFSMYAGEDTLVRFECDSSLASVIIDRFGRDITFFDKGDKFEFSAHVSLSPVFFGWVMSFGNRLRVLAPELAVEKLKSSIAEIQGLYK